MNKLYILGLLGLVACGGDSFSLLNGTFGNTCTNFTTTTVEVSGLEAVQTLVAYKEETCVTEHFRVKLYSTLSDKGASEIANGRFVDVNLYKVGFIPSGSEDDWVATICDQDLVIGSEMDFTDCAELIENLPIGAGNTPDPQAFDLRYEVGTPFKDYQALDEDRLCFGDTAELDAAGYPTGIDEETCLARQ